MVEVQLVQVHKDGVVPALEAVLTQINILLFRYVNQLFVHNLVLRLRTLEEQQVRECSSYWFWYGGQTLYTVDDTQSQVSSVVREPFEYLFQVAVAPHIGGQIVDEQQCLLRRVFLSSLFALLLDGQQVLQVELVLYVVVWQRLERVVFERGERAHGHQYVHVIELAEVYTVPLALLRDEVDGQTGLSTAWSAYDGHMERLGRERFGHTFQLNIAYHFRTTYSKICIRYFVHCLYCLLDIS
mgnify:CR=1 FL=1